MSTQPQRKFLTSTEYLEIERKAEFKSEYFNGEVFAMAGTSRAHSRISTNVSRILDTQTLTRECNVYSSEMRVKIEKIGKYTYPDIVVTCGKEKLEDAYFDTLLNPVVIIEILSASTEAYDRGRKFQHYQFIDSLAEYILIVQDAVRVEQYVRQGDHTWLYSAYQNLDDVVKLESVNCEMTLKDIYNKVPAIAASTPEN